MSRLICVYYIVRLINSCKSSIKLFETGALESTFFPYGILLSNILRKLQVLKLVTFFFLAQNE